MSTIQIRKAHHLGYEQARKTADELARELTTQFKGSYYWDKNDLRFNHKVLHGCIHIADDAIEIQIKLGVMMRPFKTKIEDTIHARLESLLGEEGSAA